MQSALFRAAALERKNRERELAISESRAPEHTKMTNEQIRETINQLGGNRFAAMVCASFFSNDGKLVIKFKGSKIANTLIISLMPDDTYSLTFHKVSAKSDKIIEMMDSVYNDMMQSVFTKITGLYTHL